MTTEYDRLVSDLEAAISRNSALCDERDKAIRERNEALDAMHKRYDIIPLNEKLCAENKRLRAMLRELEWAVCGDCSRCKTCRGWNAKCPICSGCNKCGHATDCRLAAALEG